MESLTPTLTESSENTAHSYPPTPPFSPSEEAASKSPSLVPHASSEVRQFILAPHSSPHVPQQESSSFLSRAFAAFKNHKPSHSLSFTLCPLPRNETVDSQTNASEQPASPHCHSPSLSAIVPPSPEPILTFHDRTPLWTLGSSTGLMEIDTALERETGVDRSFWVCIALAYMEFLTEREASILCFSCRFRTLSHVAISELSSCLERLSKFVLSRRFKYKLRDIITNRFTV